MQAMVFEELRRRQHVVVDLVGGDAEFDLRQRQRPQPLGQQGGRASGQEVSSGEIHARIIAATMGAWTTNNRSAS
jgi:hypothetical protein